MSTPTLRIAGIDHLKWDVVSDGDGRRDVLLRFVDKRARLLPRALEIVGLQISDWHLSECLYDRCDEVRVLDRNNAGDQLEFGRYVVQFVGAGKVLGEHLADSVAVHLAR